MPPLIFAHRAGATGAAENGLPAIRSARERGADGVEIDVRCTRDGVAIVMHDLLPLRTARWPVPIRWMTAAGVARLRLTTGEHIPTLAQAYDAAPDGLAFAVELKEEGASRAVLDTTRSAGGRLDVSIWTDDEPVVRFFAREAPDLEVVLMRNPEEPGGIPAVMALAHDWGAGSVAVDPIHVGADLFDRARDAGLGVYTSFHDLDQQRRILAGSPPLTGFTTEWPEDARDQIVGGVDR